MKTPDENILEFRNAFITTSFLDLKTTKIVIKLNIVTIAPFCFPRSRLYNSVAKHLHQQNFIFFIFFIFVASKNGWRGTLDSKTQTKERKWVSFELLKFILGSGAEGNKTGTRKGTRNLWFYRNRISYDFMFLLKGFQKDGGLDSNQKESAIRRSFFGESRRTPPKQKGKTNRLIAG